MFNNKPTQHNQETYYETEESPGKSNHTFASCFLTFMLILIYACSMVYILMCCDQVAKLVFIEPQSILHIIAVFFGYPIVFLVTYFCFTKNKGVLLGLLLYVSIPFAIAPLLEKMPESLVNTIIEQMDRLLKLIQSIG